MPCTTIPIRSLSTSISPAGIRKAKNTNPSFTWAINKKRCPIFMPHRMCNVRFLVVFSFVSA